MVVVCRIRTDQRTRAYVRRTQEGLSKREVMCCLTRYVAASSRPMWEMFEGMVWEKAQECIQHPAAEERLLTRLHTF